MMRVVCQKGKLEFFLVFFSSPDYNHLKLDQQCSLFDDKLCYK